MKRKTLKEIVERGSAEELGARILKVVGANPRGTRGMQYAPVVKPAVDVRDELKANTIQPVYPFREAVGEILEDFGRKMGGIFPKSSRAMKIAHNAINGISRLIDKDGECLTRVVFRKIRDTNGKIIAFFPDCRTKEDIEHGRILTYAHDGQHATGDIGFYKMETRPCTSREYAALRRELETNFGYRLKVIPRLPSASRKW